MGPPQEVLQVTPHTLFKLLAALNECTEWGQVFILDCLATYDMADPRDAEKIAERVLPRLQHANSAVVLSAVKVREPPQCSSLQSCSVAWREGWRVAASAHAPALTLVCTGARALARCSCAAWTRAAARTWRRRGPARWRRPS